MSSSQRSIISYVPQPYFVEGTCSNTPLTGADYIENARGIFSPDLSDYCTVVPDVGVNEFGIRIIYAASPAYLVAISMSAGFIGCSLLTYADDGAGEPDLDTAFNEDIYCAFGSYVGTNGNQLATFAHSSQNEVHTFCRAPLPGVISGGQTNLMFHSVGTAKQSPAFGGDLIIVRKPDDVTARPHARFIIGTFFVGIEIPVAIDPRSFSWSLGLENERYQSRGGGAISSDSSVIRRSSGEIVKIANNTIVGMEVMASGPNVFVPNLFDLTKVNTSYPFVFSPYPTTAVSVNSLTAELANLTARQNFFSIYGFLEDPLEFQIGEYRDGLNTEYTARFRIKETR